MYIDTQNQVSSDTNIEICATFLTYTLNLHRLCVKKNEILSKDLEAENTRFLLF